MLLQQRNRYESLHYQPSPPPLLALRQPSRPEEAALCAHVTFGTRLLTCRSAPPLRRPAGASGQRDEARENGGA